MQLSTLRRTAALALALSWLALPASAQTTTVFTVNSVADDANARDANAGDGECRDGFTNANPSADPRCTLRAAIDEANATSGDVVINLPGQLAGGASGSYTLSRVAPDEADNTYEDDNAFGDLDLGAGDAAFSSLTIRGTGTPGPEVTIGPNDRVFHLLANNVRIERVTITGGTAQPGDNGVADPGEGETVDGSDGADGGCVLVAENVTATLDQVSVNNCFTSSGGNGVAPAAADTPGGDAGDGGDGGGIANFGTLTVARSFVYANGTGDAGSAGNGTAGSGDEVAGGNGGNGGLGGGIYNAGTLTVEETTVFENTAGDPSQGAAGTNGGADGIDGEGGSGGGIASLEGGEAELRNTIVAANTAGDDVNNDGTDNAATKQPGSDLFDGDPADDDDVADFFIPFQTGTFTDGGFNLIGTNDSVEDTFAEGALVGTGQGDDATRVDPGITGANRNEGFAVTALELGSDSPAVDAGANTDLDGNEIVVDGRGFRRPGTRSGDGTVDIGGYEFESEPLEAQLTIQELDSVTAPATEEDQAEFVEVRNDGDFPVQLADFALVFFGADLQSYAAFNLTGELAPGESYVFGDPGASMVDQAGLSGTADDVRDVEGAVAVYRGEADSYTGATAGQNQSTRSDVLVYNNGEQASRRAARLVAASSLADAFGVSEDEVASGDTDDNSIQRNANGSFTAGPPTPGGNTMSGSVADVIINELDSDQTSTDDAEFVELWDGGRGNTSLDGLALVFFNGSVADNPEYRTFDLDGSSTGTDGLFVLCGDASNTPNCDLDVSPNTNLIQNGADAIALYQGDDETGTLLDVVVYGTADAIDDDLLDAFSYTQGRNVRVQHEEDYNDAKDTQSLQRINDPGQTDGYSLLFYAADPTPGATNIEEVTVDETEHVADTDGWRLLSSPVVSSGTGVDAPRGTALRVDFYAEDINLVQGVPAGSPASTFQAQYPDGEDNLFVAYNADGSYTPAPSTDTSLEPGDGFFWFWYDNDVVPDPMSFGGGTSRSFDLGGSEFEFDVTGIPLDDRLATTVLGTMGVQEEFTVGQDGFVMGGNPYAYPYQVDGFQITSGSGTLQSTFNTWDPAAGSYVQITADGEAPDADNTAPVWQGLFAEVDGVSAGNTVTVSAPSQFVVPTLENLDGIYRQRSEPAPRLAFTLTGETEAGTLTDRAASVRFLDDATAAWDRHDGSKLLPPSVNYALVALVGTRDGEPYRQGALSLPPALDAADVSLDVLATAPGQYALSWDDAALPAGLSATITDRVTGASADAGAAGSLAFELSEATDWTDRFTLAFGGAAVSTGDGPEGAVEVSAVYPNPAAGAAGLDVRVGSAQAVQVEVFDALGRRVSTREVEASGAVEVRLDTAALAPGVYVVRVTGDGFAESRRLTVVR